VSFWVSARERSQTIDVARVDGKGSSAFLSYAVLARIAIDDAVSHGHRTILNFKGVRARVAGDGDMVELESGGAAVSAEKKRASIQTAEDRVVVKGAVRDFVRLAVQIHSAAALVYAAVVIKSAAIDNQVGLAV